MAVNDQDPYSVHAMDSDPEETREWDESLEEIVARSGHQRGREVMLSLLRKSKDLRLNVPMVPTTDYINTISPEDEPSYPGDEELEREIRHWIRWNAAMLVHRAQRPGVAVGPPTPLRPRSMRSASTTFSAGMTIRVVATRSSARGTPHPAPTREPSCSVA